MFWFGEDMEKKIVDVYKKLEGMIMMIVRDLFLNVMFKEELYDVEIFKVRICRWKVLVVVGSSGLRVYERKIYGKFK